jgi:transposase
MSGRPTSCTPELIANMAECLELGYTIKLACEACGIVTSTFADWMNKGEAGEEPFTEFSSAVRAAQKKAADYHLRSVQKHANVDWRAAAWMLERRFPDDYGKKDSVKLSGEIKTETVFSKMTDEELERLAKD